VLLILLNVPLIGLWVKVLRLPYRVLFPSALFFIAVGVFSTNNSLFEVGEGRVFGVAGAVFVSLRFPVAPVPLGYVLGPMVEERQPPLDLSDVDLHESAGPRPPLTRPNRSDLGGMM
jgi:putative tricarboxylic transport membrane protein